MNTTGNKNFEKKKRTRNSLIHIFLLSFRRLLALLSFLSAAGLLSRPDAAKRASSYNEIILHSLC